MWIPWGLTSTPAANDRLQQQIGRWLSPQVTCTWSPFASRKRCCKSRCFCRGLLPSSDLLGPLRLRGLPNEPIGFNRKKKTINAGPREMKEYQIDPNWVLDLCSSFVPYLCFMLNSASSYYHGASRQRPPAASAAKRQWDATPYAMPKGPKGQVEMHRCTWAGMERSVSRHVIVSYRISK